MSFASRIFIRDLKSKSQFFLKLQRYVHTTKEEIAFKETLNYRKDVNTSWSEIEAQKKVDSSSKSHPSQYRFMYPEFLPYPLASRRNAIKEQLERNDMLARRTVIDIPEFYVGSVLAVTHSDIHAPGKLSRFVGICIFRAGCGLRSSFLLRNVVDGQPVEMDYYLYDPCIQKMECLKLEKRLDDQLLYLRDCALEYSTFPFDLEPEFVVGRTEVPVNTIQIPLLPPPWISKYELLGLKGITPESIVLNRNRTRKLKKAAQPWEKYDLMKMYRKTIPEEEQREIYGDLYTKIHQLESSRQKQKRSRIFSRPKKSG